MHWPLVGERKALSLFILGFYSTLFILVALAQGGAWARCFLALAITYSVAFFAIAAEWFWARWYAMGLGMSGVSLALFGLVAGGWNPALAIWGAMHLIIYLPLLGEAMAERYEYQEAWRRRYHLDDQAVERIRRAVKSAATALPTLIFYSLAPREGRDLFFLLLVMAGLGTFGLLRLRFWGVALLGLCAVSVLFSALHSWTIHVPFSQGTLGLSGLGLLAGLTLLVAVSPFVIPAYRYLRAAE